MVCYDITYNVLVYLHFARVYIECLGQQDVFFLLQGLQSSSQVTGWVWSMMSHWARTMAGEENYSTRIAFDNHTSSEHKSDTLRPGFLLQCRWETLFWMSGQIWGFREADGGDSGRFSWRRLRSWWDVRIGQAKHQKDWTQREPACGVWFDQMPLPADVYLSLPLSLFCLR